MKDPDQKLYRVFYESVRICFTDDIGKVTVFSVDFLISLYFEFIRQNLLSVEDVKFTLWMLQF